MSMDVSVILMQKAEASRQASTGGDCRHPVGVPATLPRQYYDFDYESSICLCD